MKLVRQPACSCTVLSVPRQASTELKYGSDVSTASLHCTSGRRDQVLPMTHPVMTSLS